MEGHSFTRGSSLIGAAAFDALAGDQADISYLFSFTLSLFLSFSPSLSPSLLYSFFLFLD